MGEWLNDKMKHNNVEKPSAKISVICGKQIIRKWRLKK